MEAVRQFENLMVDDGKTLCSSSRCFKPIWDTAIPFLMRWAKPVMASGRS